MNHDDELKRTERALNSALRRKDVPAGFAERILARVDGQMSASTKSVPRNSWLPIFSQPVLRWTVAATAAGAMLLGVVHYRELQIERERTEGEAAKQQLVLALRIAGSKLQHARSKVNQLQTNQPEEQEEKE